jgi:polysaccharide biosynthesis transport protein
MAAAESSSRADSGMQDYLHIILRRKWIVVALVVIAAISAYAVASAQQAMFLGEAQMILTRQGILEAVTGQQGPTDAASADRLVQTMADLARVPEVARRTVASAGVHSVTPSQLLDASTVTPSSDADVLTFSVTNHDQALASRLATTYAEQFQTYRHQLDVISINQAQAEVEREIHRLGNGGSQTGLYGYLIGKAEQLQSLGALQSSKSYVVRPARTAAQVQPRPMLDSVLAAVVGLLLGVALAFLAETLDTRVRSVDEIRDLLGLRILARIPGFRRQQAQMVMLAEPQSAQAEAFRTLRINLDLVNSQQELKTLMVASAQQEDGKSTILANLAVALARAGRTVAVVDCDLHRPTLHRLFEIRTARGLSEVLVGDVPIERALTPVAIDRRAPSAPSLSNGSGALTGVVEVLPGGRTQVEDELVGEGIREILRELESRFDYVLVDTPPLLEFGDGLGLSEHVDGVLVVARVKGSKRAALAELRQILALLPAEPIGIVATGADSSAGTYYASEPQEGPLNVQFGRATAK